MEDKKMPHEEKCVICDEAITNPICPECLERQVMYWIAESNKPSLVPILRGVGASVKAFTHENTTCIVCNENMNVCPHCYCSEVYMWLIDNEYGELAAGFLRHFNYELDYRFEMKAGAG
jgi:hypothetical protein